MKKHIFVINGAAGSGKDTFVDCLIIAAKDMVEVGGIENYSSVSVIKDIAKRLGWDGAKSEKDRKFLSDLKLLCKEYNDLPFKSLIHTVSNFYKNLNDEFLFIHIREPEEIERAKTAFGAKTILLKNPKTSPVESNISDKNVYNYDYDIIINNDGSISDLKELAPVFISDICDNKLKSEYFANTDRNFYYKYN